MSLTCSCSDTLAAPKNKPCDKLDLGKQITAIFIQKMEGSPFDGGTISGTSGGTITNKADWEAKIAATDDDKIIVLKNLAGITVPEASAQELSGNDVPYGGRIVTDLTRSIAGRLQYPDTTTITNVNKSRCWGKVRVWLLDERDNLQGGNEGIENVNINFMNLVRLGLGDGTPPHFPFQVDWMDLEEIEFADFSGGDPSFLKDLDNA